MGAALSMAPRIARAGARALLTSPEGIMQTFADIDFADIDFAAAERATTRAEGSGAPVPQPTPPAAEPAAARAGRASAFELRLIARVLAGDEEGAEALVRQFGGAMLAVTSRILRCDEDAGDALQDAFVQVFQKLGTFRGDCRLSTWLHRVAVNAALLKLRSRRRRHEVSLEGLAAGTSGEGRALQVEDPRAVDPGLALDVEERRRVVREQIDLLPARHREIILLRDIEGLDTEEAARMLGISSNAAKVRLHRARQALLGRLEPLGLCW